MASLEEVLLRYRLLNDPKARRYTMRISAALLFVAVAVAAGFMAFAGGTSDMAADQTYAFGAEGQPPDQIGTSETPEGVYIGYPVDAYDASYSYDQHALVDEVLAWEAQHPGAFVERAVEVRLEGQLLGYHLVLREAPVATDL